MLVFHEIYIHDRCFIVVNGVKADIQPVSSNPSDLPCQKALLGITAVINNAHVDSALDFETQPKRGELLAC